LGIAEIGEGTGKFPLYSLLTKQPPAFVDGDNSLYATVTNPEIEKDKLMHFAIGLFWKASAHSWSKKHSKPWIDLGAGSESLRLFLLGKSPLPENMALVVFVSPPPVRMIAFHNPMRGSNPDFYNFTCYVPGVHFNLCVGDDMESGSKLHASCQIPTGRSS